MCLYMTYFWPLVIKSLEGASAVSSLGANLLRKCERVFFDKKDSHGVRVLGLGLQTQEPYWDGSEHGVCQRDLILIKGNLVFTLDF